MTKLGLGILALSVFLAACEDPAANKPKATTTSAQTNAPTPKNPFSAMELQGTALAILPENSKIEFTGSKVTGKHDGGFKTFKGVIDLVSNKPDESRVLIEIDTNSVYTDADGLTKHLQTADFFDVEKFPKATFDSIKIVADAENGAENYMITGDLNLHGQTKSITFPAKITIGDTDVSVEAEFSINRKDFGIVYAGKTDDLIRDDVVIRLNLKSPRKK